MYRSSRLGIITVYLIIGSLFTSGSSQAQNKYKPKSGSFFKRLIDSSVEAVRTGKEVPLYPELKSKPRSQAARPAATRVRPAPLTVHLKSAPQRQGSIREEARTLAESFARNWSRAETNELLKMFNLTELVRSSLSGLINDKKAIATFVASPDYSMLLRDSETLVASALKGRVKKSTGDATFTVAQVEPHGSNSATARITGLDRDRLELVDLVIQRDQHGVAIVDIFYPMESLSIRELVQYSMISASTTKPRMREALPPGRRSQADDVRRLMSVLRAVKSNDEQLFDDAFSRLSPYAQSWPIVAYNRVAMLLRSERYEALPAALDALQKTGPRQDSLAILGLQCALAMKDAARIAKYNELWKKSYPSNGLDRLFLATKAYHLEMEDIGKAWFLTIHPSTYSGIAPLRWGASLSGLAGFSEHQASLLSILAIKYDKMLSIRPGSDECEKFEASDAYRAYRKKLAAILSALPSTQRGISVPTIHQQVAYLNAEATEDEEPPMPLVAIDSGEAIAWVEQLETAIESNDVAGVSRLVAWDVTLEYAMAEQSAGPRLIGETFASCNVSDYSQSLSQDLIRRCGGLERSSVKIQNGFLTVVFRCLDPQLDYLSFRLQRDSNGIVADRIDSIHQGSSLASSKAQTLLQRTLKNKDMDGELSPTEIRILGQLDATEKIQLAGVQRDELLNRLLTRFDRPVQLTDELVRGLILTAQDDRRLGEWLKLYLQLGGSTTFASWNLVTHSELIGDVDLTLAGLQLIRMEVADDPLLDLVVARGLCRLGATDVALELTESVEDFDFGLPLASQLTDEIYDLAAQNEPRYRDKISRKRSGVDDRSRL